MFKELDKQHELTNQEKRERKEKILKEYNSFLTDFVGSNFVDRVNLLLNLNEKKNDLKPSDILIAKEIFSDLESRGELFYKDKVKELLISDYPNFKFEDVDFRLLLKFYDDKNFIENEKKLKDFKKYVSQRAPFVFQ